MKSIDNFSECSMKNKNKEEESKNSNRIPEHNMNPHETSSISDPSYGKKTITPSKILSTSFDSDKLPQEYKKQDLRQPIEIAWIKEKEKLQELEGTPNGGNS